MKEGLHPFASPTMWSVRLLRQARLLSHTPLITGRLRSRGRQRVLIPPRTFPQFVKLLHTNHHWREGKDTRDMEGGCVARERGAVAVPPSTEQKSTTRRTAWETGRGGREGVDSTGAVKHGKEEQKAVRDGTPRPTLFLPFPIPSHRASSSPSLPMIAPVPLRPLPPPCHRLPPAFTGVAHW